MAQISNRKREQCCPSSHSEAQTFAVTSPHSPLPFPGTKQPRGEHCASLPPVGPSALSQASPFPSVSSPNTQTHTLPGTPSGCPTRTSGDVFTRQCSCHTLRRTGRKEKQRTKHSSNKEKTGYQHQELYANFKNLKKKYKKLS